MPILTCSVKEGTNEVISSAGCSWAGIKTGSFFRIKGDDSFFNIKSASEFSIDFEFEAINNYSLKINDDIGILLSAEDEIFILYKEYELITIFSIKEKGIGYNLGDKIKLDAELPVIDTVNGISANTILEVTEVDGVGGIKKISITSKGKYLKEPEQYIKSIGGRGSGAVFECAFKETPSKNILDRSINYIEYNDIPSIIHLHTALPKGIQRGKITCDKWKIVLCSNINKTIIASQYEVIQNFTPNIKIPLLAQNSFSRDSIINQASMTTDAEIGKLKDKIQLLESEISLLNYKIEELSNLIRN